MNAEKRQQAIRRMKELSGILKEASRAYYAEDQYSDLSPPFTAGKGKPVAQQSCPDRKGLRSSP